MINNFDSLARGIIDPVAAVRAAESAGLDSAWVGDHLYFHRPNLESVTTLAGMAGASRNIVLGSCILLPALRDPVVLAKQLATLAVLAEDRLVIGVGVGGEYEAEWAAVNVPVRERGARLDEVLRILEVALAGQPLHHAGTHYRIEAPPIAPVPRHRPPVWVGGRSPAAFRRVVDRGAGWLGMWSSVHRTAEIVDELEQMSKSSGRAEQPRVGMLFFVSTGASKAAEREARHFVETHYGMEYEKVSKWVLRGSSAEIADQIAEYRAAGVTDFILFPFSDDFTTQYDLVAEAYEHEAAASTSTGKWPA